ncbi:MULTISPECIES: hypothetical protein [Pseudomonas syringae group]|uniref:Permuted papain-like amidase enzyme, YaeF/YiiX, C92 family n=2 Tax=Pseudomonas syringae group TaxID=136849 RepID=A0ABX6H7L6_9PSED|nr:hypothetical protein [Pseudomonas asturiensis]QHF01491.1 hypothetical protein N015_03300 [Pseudomonas asturiensis]
MKYILWSLVEGLGMSYLGVNLNFCRAVPFEWYDAGLVVVSGDGPNICGHALLRVGKFYFHIAGLVARPYYMDEVGYKRYLAESSKIEIFRRRVMVKNSEAAQRKLEALSARPWHWLGIPNNCVSYVEEIFNAGGASESLLSNCPVRWR